jgi:hypothetical protein
VGNELKEQDYYLQSEEPVVALHLFSKEISADSGLVLVAELLVHISELQQSSRKLTEKIATWN